MRWSRIAPSLTLLFVCPISQADILNDPPHAHGASPICTWPAAGCAATAQHQHRTQHNPGAGVATHDDIAAYAATKSWQNDRTLHVSISGHDIFAHGHVDPPNAIRFDVHIAVAGGDISAAEAAAWNANVPAMAASVFAKWAAAGTGSGPENWTNDEDHQPAQETGIPWHSNLSFTAVTSGAHELHVELAEAGPGAMGIFSLATQYITIDDDQEWYWGINSDKTVEPDKFDLYTVLLHEAGHAAAFGHFGTRAEGSVMANEALPIRSYAGGILHNVDASATHGALDVYAIAEPAHGIPALETVGVVMLGFLLLAVGAAVWGRERGGMRRTIS